MSRLLISSLSTAFITTLTLSGCLDVDTGEHAQPVVGTGISDNGIVPTASAGNFVASDDDQVCYELNKRFGWAFTTEMKGFKIDPPTSVEHAAGSFQITQPYLAWSSNEGFSILGVIVKGGPQYNFYDYLGTGLESDSGLRSPTYKGKVPAISHYNVCYQPPPPPSEGNGCTRGYWGNHLDRWAGVSPSDSFEATFGVSCTLGSTYTLGQAISTGGGGLTQFAAQATAALLNAHGGVANTSDGATVQYPLTVEQVIELVQAALAEGGDVEGTKTYFDTLNNGGCPLGGTRATN